MSSSLPPGFELLLTKATEQDRPEHDHFLRLAVEHLAAEGGAEPALAALWLADWKQNRLLLDLVEIRDDPGGLYRARAEDDLSNVAMIGPAVSDPPAYAEACAHWVDANSKLAAFARSIATGLRPFSFPLFDRHEESGAERDVPSRKDRLVGFLQVWVQRDLAEGERDLLHWVAKFLAVNLMRHRRHRELRTLRAFRRVLEGEKRENLQLWFRTAAQALAEATWAEHCLIFTPEPGQILHGQAVWSRHGGFHPHPEEFVAGAESLIARLFSREDGVVRLERFMSTIERKRFFPDGGGLDPALQEKIDALVGHQNAWMGARIMASGQALGTVVMINKTRNLPRQFSATDEEILAAVCQYLGSVLASVVAGQIMDAALKTRSTPLLRMGKERDEAGIAELFDTLRNNIPNVSGATLLVRGTADLEDQRVIHLGGDDYLLKNERLLEPPPTGRLLAPKVPPGTPPVACVIFDVEGLERSWAHLGVMLDSPHLGEHARKMLQLFVKTALANQLRAGEILDEQLRRVSELRHNLRAGVHGMQHLLVASNFLASVRGRGHQAERILPHIVHSVERASLYTELTRVLLEAPRFLLTSAPTTRESLRLSTGHVGEVVRQVIEALRPEAKDFKVDIDLVDTIARNETMRFDREGIYLLLFNLIDNAVKYSHERGRVKVRLWIEGRYWRCEVENAGAYIDEDAEAMIFRPFVRRQQHRSGRARPGTGLGLPICSHIVRAHGGTLELRSQRTSQREEQKDLAINVFSVSIQRHFA